MKFLHAADVHLGYQQYGSKERFNDFSKAFLHIVDQALEEDVDFVLLAGDLFHKRTVDPLAMRIAIEGFRMLHEADVDLVTVSTLLGHSDVTTTAISLAPRCAQRSAGDTQPNEDDLAEAVERLG